jgi:predicted RNA-binding protein with PUA-like domain
MPRRYWLLKSEPETFSIDDLAASPDRTTVWDGVRNYQARNRLRDQVKKGDGVLFYHSSTAEPAVMGTARVVRAGYPDPTQFVRKGEYHDPKADRENPRWYAVDIRLDRAFAVPVPLRELRAVKELEGMELLRRGSRLSVQAVTAAEWKVVLGLGARRRR